MNIGKFIKLIATGACAGMLSLFAATAHAQEELYKAFGGKEGIVKIVDDFVGFAAADPRVNFQFAKTNIPHLKAMLVEMLCAGTGGPCKYTGRDMKSAHAGMGITNAQFNAIAEHMYHAWEKNNVPYSLQNKVMAILAPMQHDIVTK